MNRDEILKAAQSDENEIGEYEKNISRKAIAYGAAFGIAICCFMMLKEILIFKKFDLGKPTIIFAISGFANIYEGVKNKIRKKIVSGSIESVIAIIGLMLYIGALFL